MKQQNSLAQLILIVFAFISIYLLLLSRDMNRIESKIDSLKQPLDSMYSHVTFLDTVHYKYCDFKVKPSVKLNTRLH